MEEKEINFIVVPYTALDIYTYILDKLKELKISHTVPTFPPPKADIFSLNEGMSKVLKIISSKDGQLINGYYVTGESSIKIKCSKGHEWDTKMCKIISGSWCHTCSTKVSEETKAKISKTMKEKIATGEISKPPVKQKTVKVDIEEKKCTKCLEVQTIDNFSKKSDTADGFQPYCKECINAVKKISKENNNKTFVCEICSKIYQLKDSLTRHIKEKHSDKPVESVEFKCDVCDKICPSKASFSQHKRSHTDEGKLAQEKRVEAIKAKTKEISLEKQNCNEKTCKKCNELKSKDLFHKKKDAADGYQNVCKNCQKTALKENRASKQSSVVA